MRARWMSRSARVSRTSSPPPPKTPSARSSFSIAANRAARRSLPLDTLAQSRRQDAHAGSRAHTGRDRLRARARAHAAAVRRRRALPGRQRADRRYAADRHRARARTRFARHDRHAFGRADRRRRCDHRRTLPPRTLDSFAPPASADAARSARRHARQTRNARACGGIAGAAARRSARSPSATRRAKRWRKIDVASRRAAHRDGRRLPAIWSACMAKSSKRKPRSRRLLVQGARSARARARARRPRSRRGAKRRRPYRGSKRSLPSARRDRASGGARSSKPAVTPATCASARRRSPPNATPRTGAWACSIKIASARDSRASRCLPRSARSAEQTRSAHAHLEGLRGGVQRPRRANSTSRGAIAKRWRTNSCSSKPICARPKTKSAKRSRAASAIARVWPRSKRSWACSFRSSRRIPRPTTSAATSRRATRQESDTVTDELPRLREELARLSANVNLNAEAEREELGERDTFLRTQLEDLAKARETLLESIKEIEAQSQAQFNETFEKVSTAFTRDVRQTLPRRRCEDVADQPRKSIRNRDRNLGAAAGQEADGAHRALGRRTRDDGRRADLRADRRQTVALLSARRSRRGAR